MRFVALRPGPATPPAVLLAHCRTTLVAFEVPAVVVVEAAREHANGKIDPDALASLRARGTGHRS